MKVYFLIAIAFLCGALIWFVRQNRINGTVCLVSAVILLLIVLRMYWRKNNVRDKSSG